MASYYHMHVSWSITSYYKKAKSLGVHHLTIMFGLGSISWTGHLVHISIPVNQLLETGIDSNALPCPQDLLFSDLLHNETSYMVGTVPLLDISSLTGSLFIIQLAAHHLYVGTVMITSSLISLNYRYSHNISMRYERTPVAFIAQKMNSWHANLSINLSITGSISIVFGELIYAVPIYPYCGTDYPTILCLFCHHIWIGSLLVIGRGSHACVYFIRDIQIEEANTLWDLHNIDTLPMNAKDLQTILNHRDVIIGHLIWVTLFLGIHSFGIYIHNDSLQALGRQEDIFDDNAIQLKPIFATWIQNKNVTLLSRDIKMLDKAVIQIRQELGTSDFMLHHIHAFTIHTTVLIILKGILYARHSRLVSDKWFLGFRYPCDGPGRGGTCQISCWDHIFLAIFWMYNSVSVVLFHYSWKMQAEVWGTISILDNNLDNKVFHLSGSDFVTNSITINGWLRNYLWSQAAQVIQSSGSPISGYGIIFLRAHLIWSFSLMFLFSGRGYWQELIESILWTHHKLNIVPNIQPRALSIVQGRAVGIIHYILGGIGCSWSFFISRMVALA